MVNCYSGHGGTPVDKDDAPLPSKTVPQCGDACASNPACKAFTVNANTATGDCWLRSSITLAQCDQASPYDTYDHSPPPPPVPPPPPRPEAFALVNRIGSRGINLGNVLEAPHEGDWAPAMEEFYFKDLADRGFTAVRVGVRWDEHAGTSAPYKIDESFLSRIETVVGWCSSQGLVCSINQHHDDWIGTALVADNATFAAALQRFSAIWQQVATRFADTALEQLVFEIYNEPHVNAKSFDGHLADERVDAINAAGLRAVRAHSARRLCLVGGRWWAAPEALFGASWIRGVAVPDDAYIVAKFHWYTPNAFCWDQGTHQWPAANDIQTVNDTMAAVGAWSKKHGLPVWMNEFGVTTKQLNDSDGRASALRWFTAMYDNVWVMRGMAMNVWDTNSDYCVYGRGTGCGDLAAHAFDDGVLKALHVVEKKVVVEQDR